MATPQWDAIARSSGLQRTIERLRANLPEIFTRPISEPLSRTVDAIVDSQLAWFELAQRETGSAVFSWAAWRTARRAGKPPPDWVLTYLDQTAERLLDVANSAPPKRADAAIAEALGLSTHRGGRSPLSVFRERWERLEIAERVQEEIDSGLDETVAAQEVADVLEKDWRSVRRWWRRYRKLVDV